MNITIQAFRLQFLQVLEIEKSFREALHCLYWNMQASDEEIEVCVALNLLAGKRKREEDEAVTNEDSLLPPTKLLNPKSAGVLRTDELQAANYPHRQKLTKESLHTVRDRLGCLTVKNQEIKKSIQSLRKSVIDDLSSHMKIRQIAISQLGRDEIEDDMREVCTRALWTRKDDLFSKQKELTTIEELLGGHKAVLEFADNAFEELKTNISILETGLTTEQCSKICSYDFPHMTALARLTGGITSVGKAFVIDPVEQARLWQRPDVFPRFAHLPPEIRCLIWEQALPDSRIITHNSKHNRHLSLLAVNKESRSTVTSKLSRVLSPTFDTSKTDTRIIHTNINIDIIIRDFANPAGQDPFELELPAFNVVCYRLFIGLAKVKHLAVAFDLVTHNGGQIFGPLQACCPNLESVTFFPTSMIEGGPLKMPKQPTHQKLKFVDMDSNVIDFVHHRIDLLPISDRPAKRKALRGLAVLLTIYDHAKQYHEVFPSYVEQYGRDWNPSISVALMMKWNDTCRAWQTRTLDGDKYSKGYFGEDGKRYRGFVESGMMCGGDGELFSRYDGMVRMFGGLGI